MCFLYWSQLGGSNPGPTVYKTVALPAELSWHYILFYKKTWAGEDSNLRRRSQQIYSLSSLTTREPALNSSHLF